MLQQLREYWLPLMLFAGTLLIAAVLLLLVALMPFVADYLPISLPMLGLFANDTTVRRTSIAAAVGLIVTAFVFFRPNSAVMTRKPASKKPPGDTTAGA